MVFSVTDTVTWVGKIDWSLRRFHGEELSTHRGSTYNSFLIRDEKTILVDTVWTPYAEEFVAGLKEQIDLQQIDAIICNHGECDHTGALSLLMKEIPNVPIYCTANGVKSIRGQYHQDWNFIPVKTGDSLCIGKNTLKFIQAPMLHWPDTMFTYMEGENLLFSADAFGQHYASEMFYDDLVDQGELWFEAIKYYANIISPFNSMVQRKLQEVLAMNLEIKMICPDHGVIWRQQIPEILQAYGKWCANYEEHMVTLIYDSMWHSTEHMANAIIAGLHDADPTLQVKVHSLGRGDANDALTDAFRSQLVLIGSPTVNGGVLSTVAALLSQLTEMKWKGKKAAAFGAYGWSGEGVKHINEQLAKAGMDVVHEGVRATWDPDNDALAACRALGAELGKML